MKLINACILAAANAATLPITKRTASYGNSLSFTVVGDWGGDEEDPTTSRSLQMGQSVDDIVPTYDTDFILLVGDNFYEDGIDNVDSERWETTWKAVFQESYPNTGLNSGMKFYAQTGNHDYKGNVSAQIAYTELQDRWVLPDLWYAIPDLTFPDFSVAIITVDTDVIKGKAAKDQSKDDIDNKIQNQFAWIEQQLQAAQDFDYIIVAGHHEFYSISDHGTQEFMLEQFYPMLQKYDVSLYLSGHDHQLQQLSQTYTSSRTGNDHTIYHTLSGQGGKYDCDTSHYDDLDVTVSSDFFWCGNGNEAGYVQVMADGENMQVKHINAKTKSVLYEVTVPKRG